MQHLQRTVGRRITKGGTNVQFIFGAIGGAAPEIVRLYNSKHEGSVDPRTLFYWVVTGLFILLAGTLSMILAADNPAAAFATGLQTPFVVRGLEAAGAANLVGGTKIEEVGVGSADLRTRLVFRVRKQVRMLKFI